MTVQLEHLLDVQLKRIVGSGRRRRRGGRIAEQDLRDVGARLVHVADNGTRYCHTEHAGHIENWILLLQQSRVRVATSVRRRCCRCRYVRMRVMVGCRCGDGCGGSVRQMGVDKSGRMPMVQFRILGIVQNVAVLQEHGGIRRCRTLELTHLRSRSATLHRNRLRQRIVVQRTVARRIVSGTATWRHGCTATARRRRRRGGRRRRRRGRLVHVVYRIVERHRRHAARTLRTRPERRLAGVVQLPVALIVQRIVLNVRDDLAVRRPILGAVLLAAAAARRHRIVVMVLVLMMMHRPRQARTGAAAAAAGTAGAAAAAAAAAHHAADAVHGAAVRCVAAGGAARQMVARDKDGRGRRDGMHFLGSVLDEEDSVKERKTCVVEMNRSNRMRLPVASSPAMAQMQILATLDVHEHHAAG